MANVGRNVEYLILIKISSYLCSWNKFRALFCWKEHGYFKYLFFFAAACVLFDSLQFVTICIAM